MSIYDELKPQILKALSREVENGPNVFDTLCIAYECENKAPSFGLHHNRVAVALQMMRDEDGTVSGDGEDWWLRPSS